MSRLWDEEIMEALLARPNREAIKRLDAAHYLKCDIRKPCDICLALEAVRELLATIDSARSTLGGFE